LVAETKDRWVQSGEEIINGPNDHYHMLLKFDFSLGLILVSLGQLCLFFIYKSFTNHRSSNGGLW
jgi:hypothetical protein